MIGVNTESLKKRLRQNLANNLKINGVNTRNRNKQSSQNVKSLEPQTRGGVRKINAQNRIIIDSNSNVHRYASNGPKHRRRVMSPTMSLSDKSGGQGNQPVSAYIHTYFFTWKNIENKQNKISRSSEP